RPPRASQDREGTARESQRAGSLPRAGRARQDQCEPALGRTMAQKVESPPIADERSGSGILSSLWAGLTRGREYAPPGADTPLGQLLWSYPPPLIDPANKLVVIFSAKSACTNVLVWFFHHLGHAKAVRDYHPSPHQYRTQVYYRSKLYQRTYNLNLKK